MLFSACYHLSFAKKYKAKLYVDDESGFYKMYKYELHNLNISAPIVEKKYKFLGIGGRIKRKILQKLKIYGLKKGQITICPFQCDYLFSKTGI